jgi:hypothetical protein
MSARAAEFVQAWIAQNVHPDADIDEDGDDRPAEYAAACMRDAEAAGISRGEIDEEFDNLEDVMTQAINAAAEGEVNRLASKEI